MLGFINLISIIIIRKESKAVEKLRVLYFFHNN